ncbi:MAG: biotin/lipoyl-binding protein [Saprospiraceae bacterium]|nr:biotin/lipoyl-binding protein [Saprospiraceae bacterium]
MSKKFHVNEEFEFNDSEMNAELLHREGDWFHLLVNGQKRKARLDSVSADGKTFHVRTEGEFFTVNVKNDLDQLVDQMGLSNLDDSAVGDVEAPMPGKVLEVRVSEGDEVTAGTPLMVLEAMKMENVLKATGAGKVQKILVEKGITVDKGQLLIEMTS